MALSNKRKNVNPIAETSAAHTTNVHNVYFCNSVAKSISVTGALTYSTSFVLGAMHALEPGHGKSFIASYMLGGKLKVRGLFSMLGTLLISHFLLLTVLAILVKYIFDGVSQEYLLSMQEWVAPAIIFTFGVYLFWRYWRLRNQHDADCNCGLHEKAPSASTGPIDVKGLVLDHGKDQHHHKLAVEKSRNPAMVGLITGLIPCPSALAPVFLSATASFDNVLSLIGVYVIGMILVLAGIVGAFFVGRNLLASQLERVGQRVNLHLVSALLIMAVGVVYFAINLTLHMDPAHIHAGHVH